MAAPSDDPAGGYVTVALIRKTQGRRGELAAEILTDIPGRFDALRHVSLLSRTGVRQPVELVHHWPHKGHMILQFDGIADISSAEAWLGAEVQVPLAQRPAPPSGQVFVSDLVGCAVHANGRDLGSITAVEGIPGAPTLLRVGETLIPFAQEYIVRLDLPARRLDLQLPPGLLEI